ncbi:hypothetical protein, partial [Thiolapillus sp.]|uniref:hypothetical protein n=1 Tax=Thiolapillus sp. TaxID=2017437 RepID=UPI003AF50D93
ASSTPDTCQGLLIPSIWAYRSLSLIGDYDNLPTPFGEEPKWLAHNDFAKRSELQSDQHLDAINEQRF